MENRKVVITINLDVKRAFDAAWWPNILKGLKGSECPRNLYCLSQGCLSQRTAVMSTNSVSIERSVTKGCPQESCCGPGFWNLFYSSLLKLDFTSHSNVTTFADDLIILTKKESIVEAENYLNLELRKFSDWAQNNKLKFNEHKSKVMLMSRRKRKEKKEVQLYLNNKIIEQVTYLLTPRCRVLPEQLTGLQLVKKFPAFHGTRRFITALTSVRQSKLTV